MPDPVVRAITDHLESERTLGGYEAESRAAGAIEDTYGTIANLLGAQPHQIAFIENATAAFSQALSAVPFEAGDILLTTRNDYVSNQIQFLSLQKRLGIRILRAPDSPQGGVDVDAMESLIKERRPKLVCVTQVPTNSGLIQDAQSVGRICAEYDVLYLVDACQSVGQMPVDVTELHCDFLSASARKFLRGPRGAGFLYVSDRVLDDQLTPLFVDMRGADWTEADRFQVQPNARRFENWEFAWALVLGTGAAARYALDLGLPAIRTRVNHLAETLRQEVAAIDGVTVLDRGGALAGIVSLGLENADPADIAQSLRGQGINTTAQVRMYAVLDYDDKAVTHSLRLSPHYYNTEDEIEEAVATLRELLRS